MDRRRAQRRGAPRGGGHRPRGYRPPCPGHAVARAVAGLSGAHHPHRHRPGGTGRALRLGHLYARPAAAHDRAGAGRRPDHRPGVHPPARPHAVRGGRQR